MSGVVTERHTTKGKLTGLSYAVLPIQAILAPMRTEGLAMSQPLDVKMIQANLGYYVASELRELAER
jgi:hypothetical protein